MGRSGKRSAGLLMYRERGGGVEVFLVHPGGPMWARKDEGAWTIPKGEYGAEEEALAAAQREFHEETGFTAAGKFLELGWVRQKSGKVVTAWAFAGDCDESKLVSNTCEIEWPPRSKKKIEVPEIDRGRWYGIKEAGRFLRAEQRSFLEVLAERLAGR